MLKKSEVLFFVGLAFCALSTHAAAIDTKKIEELTGLSGKLNEQEGVFKVSKARTDVKITVDGWAMPPFMGLTSWASFKPGIKASMMLMGDLVLFEDEVNPVLGVLLENGVSVTALHNHFFYDKPKVYFMHIGGEGSLETLALGVRGAFDKVTELRAAKSKLSTRFSTKSIPATSKVTGKPIEEILGKPGQAVDGMFKAVIGREVTMACGCGAGKDMGINTWAAFAGTDDNAVVDGDFAVLEDELQAVLKALHRSNINIVAIHHHMVGETPRMLFLHYWGRGKALDLARGIKMALDLTK